MAAFCDANGSVAVELHAVGAPSTIFPSYSPRTKPPFGPIFPDVHAATSVINAAFFVRGVMEELVDSLASEHAVSTRHTATRTFAFLALRLFTDSPSPQGDEKFRIEGGRCEEVLESVVLAPHTEENYVEASNFRTSPAMPK
jgi:hypothetical protein